MSTVKAWILILLLAGLSIPAMDKWFGLGKRIPLQGDFYLTPCIFPTFKTWWDGTLQQTTERCTNDSVGFREFWVRLFNQADYSLFRIAHATRVVVGRNHDFFATHYMDTYFGKDFAGKPYIDWKVGQMKRLQDVLKRQLGIDFLVLFAPSKSYICQQDFPTRYRALPLPEWTNQTYYVKRCREAGVNHIDFTGYFLQIRDTVPYKLMPATGIHWSSYGVYLAADTIRRFIEHRLGHPLPRMILDSVIISYDLRKHDYEIPRTMNLLCEVPYLPGAYPVVRYEDTENIRKPRALFIGDSYYWHFQEEGYIGNLFANDNFWYYCKDVYPESYKTPTILEWTTLLERITGMDIIILIQVNAGHGTMGYDFLDEALAEMDPSPANPYRVIEKQIKGSPEWLEMVRKKAEQNLVSLDRMIRLDAIYLVKKRYKKLH